jgi:flagellar FliL protein
MVDRRSLRGRRLNALLTMRDDGRVRRRRHETRLEAEMAKKPRPADEEGEETGAEPKGKGPKKLVLLAAAGVALCAMAGGGYYFFLGRHGPEAEAHAAKTVAFVDIREMTINLGAEPNQEARRVLKLKAALEVHDPKTAAQIQPSLPRVEDALQAFLRELRPSELDGSAGTYYLREELLRRVNLAVHPAKVDAILFRDMLIQ